MEKLLFSDLRKDPDKFRNAESIDLQPCDRPHLILNSDSTQYTCLGI